MTSLAQRKARNRFAHASRATRKAWARKAARTRSRHSSVTGLSRKHQSLCKDFSPHGVHDTHLSECRDFDENPRKMTAEESREFFKRLAQVAEREAYSEDARMLRNEKTLAEFRKRRRSRNPELLIHGLSAFNPEGGSAMFATTSNPRHRRGRKSRRKGGKRSWRAFVRKHKGMIKRLGLGRGIRKIARMWKRVR